MSDSAANVLKQNPLFANANAFAIQPSVSQLRASKDGEAVKPVLIAKNTAFVFANKQNTSKVANTHGKNEAPKLRRVRAGEKPPPESWVNFLPSDQAPYALATKPMSQKLCGSCFSFAVANSVSDAFVFGKRLPFNPEISPMAVMACMTDPNANLQCDGGDTLTMLTLIAEDGVTTSNCLDFSKFCNESDACSGSSRERTMEKNAPAAKLPVDILKSSGEPKVRQVGAEGQLVMLSTQKNMPIPPCRCCTNKSCETAKYWKYFVDPDSIHIVSLNDLDLGDKKVTGTKDAVVEVKQHLLQYGAVVTGMVVFKNFLNGKFDSTRNIYFEDQQYEVPQGKDPMEIVGAHALSIVGWGIEKNPITLTVNGKQKVVKQTPYWVVRNSWGRRWGRLDGYFKMAMWQPGSADNDMTEINGKTCFERTHLIEVPPVNGVKQASLQTIAIITFKPGNWETFTSRRSDEAACLSQDALSCSAKDPAASGTLAPYAPVAPGPPAPLPPSPLTSPPSSAPLQPALPPSASSPPTSSAPIATTPVPHQTSFPATMQPTPLPPIITPVPSFWESDTFIYLCLAVLVLAIGWFMVKKFYPDLSIMKWFQQKTTTVPAPPPSLPIAQPAAKPSLPIAQPADKPSLPVIQPVAKPSLPVIQPVARPSLPVAKPSLPVTQPVARPSLPVPQPVAKPSLPVTQPVARPSLPVPQPVAKLSLPVTQPVAKLSLPVVQPVARPSLPVNQPVVKPSLPVTQPVARASLPIPQTSVLTPKF